MTINQKNALFKDNSLSARRKKHLLAKKKKRAKKQGIFIDSPPKKDLITLSNNYQKGYFKIAIKLGTLITQNYPNHPLAWNILGASLFAVGKIEESLLINRKLVKLSPKDSRAVQGIALEYCHGVRVFF